MDDLKELIEFVAKALVDDPDDLDFRPVGRDCRLNECVVDAFVDGDQRANALGHHLPPSCL